MLKLSLQLIDASEIKFSREIPKNSISVSDKNYRIINDIIKTKICSTIKEVGIERITNAHRIGYACVNTSIDATTNKTCRLENCNSVRLRDLISSNLDGLKKIIEWNIEKRIMLYRISSVVIPFASHEINKILWWDEYEDKIIEIGRIIKNSGMRVSMHPGQYVNINSPNSNVVNFSVKELEYHAKFMDVLGLDSSHRIILHVGGAYGDKNASIKRFLDVLGTLPENIKSKLTIENDDKIYNVWDVLDISLVAGIPIVFDLLHHQVNHSGTVKDKDIKFILEQCFSTWSNGTGGIPKIHFSTQRPNARYGVHNEGVDINALMELYFEYINYNFDIMLETKDKEISVLGAMELLEDAKNWLE